MVNERSFAQRNNGTVIHGVIEDGARENQAVNQCNGDADGNSGAGASQRAAGRGTVKVNGIIYAREQRGNHERLSFGGETDMADETLVQNLVNSFTVVRAAMRFADHTRALGWREGIGH